MAVVSQPFDRGCRVSLPGRLDETLDQFWENAPWQIMMRHNQSGLERNRAFLNVDGRAFIDMSYLTAADTDGDSRAVAAGDFNSDGRMDLIVRGVGGGPLKLYENNFPQKHYLKISLHGTKSNRLGIGAGLNVWTGKKRQVRELYPNNSFSSQAPCMAHFSLGDSTTVDQLTIPWPSGATQEFEEISADQHIAIHEESDEIQVVTPGRLLLP
jgi:hypothetical protein